MLIYKKHPAIIVDQDRFDEFFLGYTQGIGFTSTVDSENGGESLVANGGGSFDDNCPESWNEWSTLLTEAERDEIINDAANFFCEAKHLFNGKDEQAGTDFHLTRNGHGSGFWDGDWPKWGNKLTEMSKPYGSLELLGTKTKKGKLKTAYIIN